MVICPDCGNSIKNMWVEENAYECLICGKIGYIDRIEEEVHIKRMDETVRMVGTVLSHEYGTSRTISFTITLK